MRTLWKGSISFGLVNVPIKMYSATQKDSLHFKQLHDACHTPVTYQKFCPKCEQTVSHENLVKGYEYEKGKYVVLQDEDFDNIPVASTRTIDIVDFVDLEEIDPIYFSKSYYLSPHEGGEKAYILLSQAMRETNKVAIAKITIRNKESLACIRVLRDETICLETIFYPAEVRSSADLKINDLIKKISINSNELKMAKELINNLSSEFAPDKYTDEYREELLKIIRRKVEGQDVKIPERMVSGKVVDLMEALRASLETAKGERAEEENQLREREVEKVAR